MQLMVFAGEQRADKFRIGLTDEPQEGVDEWLGVEFPELLEHLSKPCTLGTGWDLDYELVETVFTCDHGRIWHITDALPTAEAGLCAGRIWIQLTFDVECLGGGEAA